MYITYLPLAGFLEKANSGRATAVFARSPWRQIPVYPGWIPPTKLGILDLKTSRVEPILWWGGSSRSPEASPAKKGGVFDSFFSIFPHIFIPWKVVYYTIVQLDRYLSNICGGGACGGGDFCWGVPHSRAWRGRKVVPTIVTHPRNF